MKYKEGSLKVPAPGLTEKQILLGELQTEKTQYEGQLIAIDRQVSQDQMLVEAGRRQALEAHIRWWTSHRNLLIRYYSEIWYNANAPSLT